MTSKNDLPDEPKTPHEEVMFVVESTNDIVSKFGERLDAIDKHLTKMFQILEKCYKFPTLENAAREQGLTVG